MDYETHDFLQGSDAWHANRAKCFNASELAAAAGESTNTTRNALIASIATGAEREFSEWVLEHIINPGHRFEALARPLAEAFIGEDLYPSVLSKQVPGLSRRLGSSLDGKVMDDSTNWEHKRLNAELAVSLDQGIIPPKYHWQMEQGQMINGATKTLFTASDWDENDNLIDIKHVWYESNPELRAKIIPTWKQVQEDAANYKPVEVIPAAVAAPTLDLPIVSIQTSGSIAIISNLRKFGEALNSFIERLPTKPSTDQEFADCKAALAKLKTAEETLESEEARALSQMAEIDEMRREKKLYQDLARTTRLALEKLVTARESQIKVEIVTKGKTDLADHIANLNTRLGKPYMPVVAENFSVVIKNKRTVASLQGAVDDELARCKIAANEIADKIQINLNSLRELASEHAFLFADTAQIVLKANDDLVILVKSRIAEHKAEQDRKLEAEREKIRKEEQERADREAAAKVEAERKTAEAVKTVNVEQTQTAQAVQPVPMQASPTLGQVLHAVVPIAQSTPQDTAWKIAGLVSDMQEIERVRVLQFCERVIEQRQQAAA